MQDNQITPLSHEQLRWTCPESYLEFTTTSDLSVHASETQVVGQDRAIKAIELGLEVKSPGYNIFVTGLVGTGKKTTVRQILERFPTVGKELRDSLFVYNFKNQDVPRYLSLPAGQGKKFKLEMKQFVDALQKDISKLFGNPEYQERRKRLDQELQDDAKQKGAEFEKHVNNAGFTLGQLRIGTVQKLDLFVKTNAGKLLTMHDLEMLVERGDVPKAVLEEKQKQYDTLKEEMDALRKQLRQGSKKFQEALERLNKETVAPLIKQLIQEIKDAHAEEAVRGFLGEVEQFVLDNSERFVQDQEEKPKMVENSLQALLRPQTRPFVELQVNLVVDNSEQKGPPIVVENHPTFKNLFGGIERSTDGAESDHTNIKSGSLLRAHGGYLVLNALDVLIEPGVWAHLKRTLRTGKLEIQNSDTIFVFGSRIPIKPEAIQVELKVLMVGDARIYHALYNYEEDFLKIFKVKAEFDSETRLTKENIMGYARFAKRIIDDEKLLPFDRSAIAALCEFAARIGGKQNRLSTQLSLLADVMREADHWARKEKIDTVSESHVDTAINQRIFRVNLVEDKLKELMADGIIKVAVTGSTIGQLNGLSVVSLGDYAFGQPSRITVTTAMGTGGIMNIERQAGMSGRTHTKGVAVLTGFISSKFAQDKPLAVSARICFEQNYGGIDGDSASSTEVYGLLSSLAEVPLRQDLAVTGSVSQLGEIQPIGGVNEKIEGFFDVCKAKKYTGTQGVLIPHLNVGDLMLRKDVVQAVKEGSFHIYAVKHIDEGIELLSGIRAGSPSDADSVYGKVDQKLRKLATEARRFGRGEHELRAKL